MLTISKTPDATPGHPEGQHRFECRTCPYQYLLDKPYFETKRFATKKAAEILGGAGSMDMHEKIEARCRDEEHCDGRLAYVYQLQIRSADEPMTTFFTCVKCLRRWQEN